ncbi:diguanylate cyclase [Paraglaciecola sp.]|uniref:GGDEF domain-containing protein n=1 Tax=Paraglaciecola sp. TaxID=1920173 RepID=UPI003EF182D1
MPDPASVKNNNNLSNKQHLLFQTLSKPIYNKNISSILNMINFIAEGIFVINQQGVIEALNPLAAKFFGDSKENLIGHNWFSYLHDGCREDYEYILSTWSQNKSNGYVNNGPKEVLITRADGTWLEADLSLSSLAGLCSATGNLIVGVLHNLTEHKKEYGELKRKAYTDHLTGLSNRYALDKKLRSNWHDSLRDRQPLSLIIIDVDYFKCFNDEFGHVKGDKCLQKIAKVIEDYLPTRECIAARYGGEEFAVILPRCDIYNASGIAGLIQQKISSLSFADIGLPASFRITVSQGIACEQGGKYQTSESLICAADSALYTSKAEGRNRISKGD